METFFNFLQYFEDFLWGYVGVPAIMFLGIYLSFKSNFVQIRKFPSVVRTFFNFIKVHEHKTGGVHPLKAFFACVGGCVGVGNVVGICTAIQIGGPGALFWIWVTAIVGMMVKYSEVYLGVRYRVPNTSGSYNGGPMYYLQKVFRTPWIPTMMSLMLCIYGIEVYQFSVVTNSISHNLNLNLYLVIFVFLMLVMYAASGGVRRVGSISSAIIPFFVIVYVGMGFWVLIQNLTLLPVVLNEVFTSAFTGYAAAGGLAGSLLTTISQGVRRGCYTGDLGVGYASVIHSESCATVPEKQASLVIFDIFLDTFLVCTTSVMLILVTDVWREPMATGLLVQKALGQYFPYMDFFMPFFLFLIGYATINAYFCVGLKCAEFVSPKRGRLIYFLYALLVLPIFSFVETTQAQMIMTIAGGFLLVFNCYGIYRLRHEISFNIDAEPSSVETTVPQPVLVSLRD